MKHIDITTDRQMEGAADASERSKFHANRYQRNLFQCGAAAKMGAVAALICCRVSMIEDQARRSPVAIHNSQLQRELGIAKWETFDKWRTAAVEWGGISYIAPPKGKRQPGIYATKLIEFNEKHIQESDTDHIQESDTVDEKRIRESVIVDEKHIQESDTDHIQESDNFHPSIFHPTAIAVTTASGQSLIDFENAEDFANKFTEFWNLAAKEHGFPSIRSWIAKPARNAPPRIDTLRERLTEPNWATEAIEVVNHIVDRIKAGDGFYIGKKYENFKANIDWLLRPGQVAKELEKRDANGNGRSNGRQPAMNGNGRHFDEGSDLSEFCRQLDEGNA